MLGNSQRDRWRSRMRSSPAPAVVTACRDRPVTIPHDSAASTSCCPREPARGATMSSGLPRVLHAPVNVAGGPGALAAGMRDLGMRSTMLVFNDHRFGLGYDRNLRL